MRNATAWVRRFVDVRPNEMRALLKAFALLLLLITSHTILETARDALVLTRIPARSLGIIYVAVAMCVLPAAGLAARATERFDVRKTLAVGLVVTTVLLVALFVIPTTRTTSVAVYVTSALIGAVLVPLYWTLVGTTFNMAQARRLLGIVGAAGVLGAAFGSATAAALLMIVRVKVLLLVSAGGLLVGASALAWTRASERAAALPPTEVLPSRRVTNAVRDEPFLGRIALLVGVATAAALFLDYFFKWSVARTVPRHEIAGFIARYYVWLNGLSLVAQTFLTGALVRRVGVATTMVVTPLLLLMGGAGVLATGGLLTAVLVLKGFDGTLHNSLHRLTTELVYLPVSPRVRARAKPFIDGALPRVTQAVAGVLLLALGGADYLSSRLLTVLALVAIVAWLAVAITMRSPYLALLRRAVTGDAFEVEPDLDPIDQESAERLVEYLAHPDRLVVLGALNVLARRGRERSIPALILLHEDDSVLVRALAIFGASAREDWMARARRLFTDGREAVRIAAVRAVAMHRQLDATDLALDAGPRLRAYATLHRALASLDVDPVEDASVVRLLELSGKDGEEARLGLLVAIADAPPDRRFLRLLEALESRAGASREWTELLAKAASSQLATELIPRLVPRLVQGDSREVVREALVSLGAPAMDNVWATLTDSTRERRLRATLPNTLARFGTKAAAELLLKYIETGSDGLVRYKAIRGLSRLVAASGVTMDRIRIERLSFSNLAEHFRLLALRAAFEALPSDRHPAPTERLLIGLLDDKLHQSLERTFRLLKIAHPRDDLHRVQIASLSSDVRARANAGEFLDALLRKSDQRVLRELLLILADDLSATERVARASLLLHTVKPITHEAALARMVDDEDPALASLAMLHVATLAGKPVRVAIGAGLGERPPVELTAIGAPPATGDAREGSANA